MCGWPTLAMDDDPAVIFGDMLCNLLARELDFLLVVAVAVHLVECMCVDSN